MKIVLNKCYGGFDISERAYEICNIDPDALPSEIRINSTLIELIENVGAEPYNGRCARLVVVEIPTETTDWEVEEYDGFEWLTYVVDGKIFHK